MLCFVKMMLIIIMDRLDSDRDTEAEIETTVRFDSFQMYCLTHAEKGPDIIPFNVWHLNNMTTQ